MESLWSGVIGVAGVIVGVVLGFLLTNWSRRSEKLEERVEKVRFNVYRLLLDLDYYHFFIASSDMRGEVTVLERYDRQKKAGGVKPAKLKERLGKARELLERQG
jgi:hypothetical protein